MALHRVNPIPKAEGRSNGSVEAHSEGVWKSSEIWTAKLVLHLPLMAKAPTGICNFKCVSFKRCET